MSSRFRRTSVPGSFFGNLTIDTTGDSIKLWRALDVVHALECLVRREEYEALKELSVANDKDTLDEVAAKALGSEMIQSFCRAYSGKRSHDGVLLNGVKSTIDEVLKPEVGGRFSVASDRYQQRFQREVMKKRPNAKKMMDALRMFKELTPQDFKDLRVDMTLDISKLDVQGLWALAHVKILDRGCESIIDAAEEVLRIGFDPETLEERLEL